jgi:2-haloacid dehalogenase
VTSRRAFLGAALAGGAYTVGVARGFADNQGDRRMPRVLTLPSADRSRILQGMLTLPAHPDVRDGLQTMRDAGLRLVTLTNSAPAAVLQQLANAGLASFFERSFSVDTVRRFKPAPEAYRSVADGLGIPVGQLRLVAAHAWDIVGALRAGWEAAFVARPGKVLYPLGPQPDIVGPDFRAVARSLVAAEQA